jgi:hypothetical protein
MDVHKTRRPGRLPGWLWFRRCLPSAQTHTIARTVLRPSTGQSNATYRALFGLTPLVEGSSRAWRGGPGDASTRGSGGQPPARQGAVTSRRQKCPIERWRTRSDEPLTTLLMVGEDGGAHPADFSMRTSVMAPLPQVAAVSALFVLLVNPALSTRLRGRRVTLMILTFPGGTRSLLNYWRHPQRAMLTDGTCRSSM